MFDIRALSFDIQGTAVDFYEPIMRMGAAANARKQLAIDWAAFCADWRRLYRDRMDSVNAGARAWMRVDAIHREALDRLLEEQGLADRFSGAERAEMNEVWTRLDPWPDSEAGLRRLREKFTLATLSNTAMGSAIAMMKHARLSFDAVFTAELARAYKPDPSVYRLCANLLGLPPGQIMMVACHKYDLVAAKAFGMRTAFVARPLEFGPNATPDVAYESAFDINARDFLDLADQLGA